MSLFQLLLLLVLTKLSSLTVNSQKISDRNVSDPSLCPLNFSFLHELAKDAPHVRLALTDVATECQYIQKGILLVRSDYLRTSGSFVPPNDSIQACWESYRILAGKFLPDFDMQHTCGYHPEWFSSTYMNITSREKFESLIPGTKLQDMKVSCNQSLSNPPVCQSCIDKLRNLQVPEETANVSSNASASDSDYMFMYAAAFSNPVGPRDPATAKCLFELELDLTEITSENRHKSVISGVVLGSITGVLGASIVFWVVWTVHMRYGREKIKTFDPEKLDDTSLEIGFGGRATNLVKFRIEQIKIATKNFSRNNIIGKGGYGNVYRGTLPDGSEVALKRFKNCSASGDASFAHEVEVIASVKHVNLLTLRGYCTATVPLEGHQRIIVCDLVKNGSLYDHLFGTEPKKLSWPIRQKIALGTARGLAYLHHGVHPAIIHRDIKASNILLDETLEAKVADFGLARFNLQGMSHLSTRAAGTLGYVAPEYALYGKLTERSDVYSFGVVLLELLSGKKAYENEEGRVSLLTDWAWSLVKEGKAKDIIDENIPELESPELMEQYVHIAVICAHPELLARPTMYQIVNILENNLQHVSSTFGTYISAGSCSGTEFSHDSYSYLSTSSDEHIKDAHGSCTVIID